VANHSKGNRRGRASRKRRPVGAAVAGGDPAAGSTAGEGEARERKLSTAKLDPAAKRRSRGARQGGGETNQGGGGGFRDPLSVGARPPALWHPLPLSELLILVGAIGTVFGLRRGISHGGPPLFAGIAAVVIGTVEVTLREHLNGYRSHTLILALLPVIVLHTLLVLLVLPPLSRLQSLALLAFDVALVTFLFKLLRARFLDARRERTLAGRR
jgi:hypothetical protein